MCTIQELIKNYYWPLRLIAINIVCSLFLLLAAPEFPFITSFLPHHVNLIVMCTYECGNATGDLHTFSCSDVCVIRKIFRVHTICDGIFFVCSISHIVRCYISGGDWWFMRVCVRCNGESEFNLYKFMNDLTYWPNLFRSFNEWIIIRSY